MLCFIILVYENNKEIMNVDEQQAFISNNRLECKISQIKLHEGVELRNPNIYQIEKNQNRELR